MGAYSPAHKYQPHRVLVVGSSGFVGSAITRAAVASGCKVASIARSGVGAPPVLANAFDVDTLASAIERFRPDVLVHAAGRPSVAATESDVEGAWHDTVLPFRNVVTALHRTQSECCLAYMSSAAVYGNSNRLPISEDAPLRPISAYGRQRIECEDIVADYSSRTGNRAFAVRIFSLFGGCQRRLLVWELFNQIANDKLVVIAGTGNEMRDFMHIDDFAAAVIRLVEAETYGAQAVNIASGFGTTVRELTLLMLELMGVDKDIICEDRVFPNDPLHWQADISRYTTLTSSTNAHDLRRALRRALEEWR